MRSLNPRLRDWHGCRVWIIGASSGIGASLAAQLQSAGARLALSARRETQLRQIAGETDRVLPLDVGDVDALQAACDELLADWQGFDMVFYCAGDYAPMRAWEIDLDVVRNTLDINLHGIYNLLAAIMPVFDRQRAGGLCLVASVAGYTGLPKALAYGPGKAAVINLAQILYADLSSRGVGVYLVNPGFVETRLTQKNDFDMPVLISPDEAASEIIAGIGKGRFEIHFPARFTLLMKCLSRLPDRLRFYLLKKAVV